VADKSDYSWFEAIWVVRISDQVKSEAAPSGAGAPGAEAPK
jgi:hypothetical protein